MLSDVRCVRDVPVDLHFAVFIITCIALARHCIDLKSSAGDPYLEAHVCDVSNFENYSNVHGIWVYYTNIQVYLFHFLLSKEKITKYLFILVSRLL